MDNDLYSIDEEDFDEEDNIVLREDGMLTDAQGRVIHRAR